MIPLGDREGEKPETGVDLPARVGHAQSQFNSSPHPQLALKP